MKDYAFWIAIAWAFVVVIWWSYDVLNEELNKRDTENLLRSPDQRKDRAYRLIHRLILEGRALMKEKAPDDRIQEWDDRVRLTLAQWCSQSCCQIYEWNSRPSQQLHLENVEAAIKELESVLQQPHLYIK